MRYVSRSLCLLLCSLCASFATANDYHWLSDEESPAAPIPHDDPAAGRDDSLSSCYSDSCCSSDCCDACDSCCERRPLLGFIQPTDTCWANFISPMTNPVYFEDPRTLTEARLIFINHKLPSLLNGAVPASSLQVLALQMRAAISEDLSIIATKDGFVFADSDAPLDDGWANIAAGLKYNLWKDVASQRILSAGLTFEIPTGTPRALQGRGDGIFDLFLTGGAQLGNYSHAISAAGFLLPCDRTANSSLFYWSNHFDTELVDNFYGFVEFNWYHWMGSGDGGIPGVEGLDFFNLGSSGVSGNDIVTGAFGIKVKPTVLQEIGVAWEFPLTERRDVIDNRLTADWIIRY